MLQFAPDLCMLTQHADNCRNLGCDMAVLELQSPPFFNACIEHQTGSIGLLTWYPMAGQYVLALLPRMPQHKYGFFSMT